MGVVIPPPQLKVTPPVLDEAMSVSLLFKQVNTVGDVMLAPGAVIFWVTVVVALLVQPFDGSVAVTV